MKALRWAWRFALLCSAALASPAFAQGIESVLAPGKLSEAHAKWDDDCKQCHVRFDRNAQDKLCTTCHKDVGHDMRERAGFHGRQKQAQACRSCHTEHKGRGMRLAEFDRQRFDHTQTDYVLRGRHLKAECTACHLPAHKYREAPQDCLSCHRKDDTHKGSLGPKCHECHTENHWKEARLDHDKTRFPLTGKHADTSCAGCHKDTQYRETPRACIGCHKRADEQRGHKGQFGERCESCHGTRSWKGSLFNHDADTRFTLRGKHRAIECTSCHLGPLYRQKTASDCFSCHRKDDRHQGSLGRECASCHTERDWKERARFDHAKTAFPLLGRHADTECKACHKSALFKEAPKDCIGCHRKDDKHQGTLGERCEGCHAEKNWKMTAGRFDHDKTRFALRNAHARTTIPCAACHLEMSPARLVFRTASTDCVACHRQDDRHEGQLGAQCSQCHTDLNWRVSGFDHAKTRFPLTGGHLIANCKDCHLTPRFKDAKAECHACHRKDDRHQLRFGPRCDTCHITRDWKSWSFDHNQRTRYRLEGAHAKAACESCHAREAPRGKDVAPLGTGCVSCHRHEDAHDGQFGPRCEQCHRPESWKRVTNLRTGSLQRPRWLE